MVFCLAQYVLNGTTCGESNNTPLALKKEGHLSRSVNPGTGLRPSVATSLKTGSHAPYSAQLLPFSFTVQGTPVAVIGAIAVTGHLGKLAVKHSLTRRNISRKRRTQTRWPTTMIYAVIVSVEVGHRTSANDSKR